MRIFYYSFFILVYLLSFPSAFAKAPVKKDTIFYKTSIADIADASKNSVVNVASLILIQDEQEMAHRMRNLFVDPKKDLFGAEMLSAPKRAVAVGSGFIIKKEGCSTYYVVTNHHVVQDAISMRIILADESIHHATLVGKDADTDIAVLKFETSQDLKILKWGDSEKLRIGEWSIVLGNPYGLGGTSLTTGVISYLARDLSTENKRTLVDNYIQTEAAINPGNSGGPLLNIDGEVIGVNTSIISTSGSNHSVGFAVPASLAQDVAEKLIVHGKVHRSWFGTTSQSLNQYICQYFGLKDTKGALITKVTKGSPAEKAGICAGDIVISINKKPIKKFTDLTILGKKIPIGTTSDFEIIRKREKITLHPIMQEYQSHEAFQDSLKFDSIILENHAYNTEFDFGVTPLTPQFRQRFEISDFDIEGVLVADVKEEGIAAQFTFTQGDVILEINEKKIRDIHDVNQIIKDSLKKDPHRPILFLLHREGSRNTFVAIDPKTKDIKGKDIIQIK